MLLLPQRTVHTADALAWLSANPSRSGMSIATSLPDLSETPHRTLAAWTVWFTAAASQIFDWLPPQGMAIFYQSDIRHEGIWIDKAYLVQQAAEARGVHLVWHKIACRKPPGTLGIGRPSYAHLLCFSKRRAFALREPGPDVLADAGSMSFSRATGAAAARVACAYLRASTESDTVVDPFCGEGTMLAAANAEGLAAVGIDINEKRVSKARRLTL